MRIDLVFPALPPKLDGIGDYTARLAAALAAEADVRILTAQADADPVPGVRVNRAFSSGTPLGLSGLLSALRDEAPDWLVLQFNQFSYGRWGLNPVLPLLMRRVKRRFPSVRIAWMAHEDFVPATTWKRALMTLWQRWQFWMLGRQADLVFLSIDPWAKKYRSWFPDTPVLHLPVGSNMPRAHSDRGAARREIGLREDAFVAGIFGSAHASRMLPRVRAAAQALNGQADDFTVLYVGPHGGAVREALGAGIPLKDAGALPAEAVSLHLAAMDVHLSPFIDGASTRRGSFMAGIQHGIATVSTDGPLTDAMLREQNGSAFQLAPVGNQTAFVQSALGLLHDSEQRERMGEAGRAFYDAQFSWEAVSAKLLRSLQAATPPNLGAAPAEALS